MLEVTVAASLTGHGASLAGKKNTQRASVPTFYCGRFEERARKMFPKPTKPRRRNTHWIKAMGVFIILCAASAYVHGSARALDGEAASTSSVARQSPGETPPFQFIETENPRDTIATFMRLTREIEDALLVYRNNQTRAGALNLRSLHIQQKLLLDLSSVPHALRVEVGSDKIAFLQDILGRIELPPMDSIPGREAVVGDEAIEKWRIPNTPITIVRIKEGAREGEFLFSAKTVEIAPEFYERVKHLPLRSSSGIESWTQTIPQWHGAMIPAGFVSALPDSLKRIWLDTPIWKILIVVMLSAVATLLLFIWHRLVNYGTLKGEVIRLLRRVLTPLAIIGVILALRPFVAYELNMTGTFSRIVDFTTTLLAYLAMVWIFYDVVLALFEWIILSPKIPDESLDANLLRLLARVVGFVGGGLIVAYGAQEVGVPVLGLLAGVGVGGLAVALAIRPTLENLIGGAILYMDRPVRVGDYCSFGTNTGTVENIGVRSTQVRARDRTLISIPNAVFANMEITNWAKCDMMQILTTIGLRYETKPDQLRYLLAKIREMFIAHPKIDRETVRVRFVGHGASSFDVQIRVYALTREWNEFFAIREDVLLRVNEIVEESGTGFAFPSRTVYMGQDGGLDTERSDAAMEQVVAWRKSGELPFPETEDSKVEQLAGTLDYPPYGSPGFSPAKGAETEEPVKESAELLSTESEPEDSDESEQPTEPERR